MDVAVALYEEVGALSAADSEEARLLRRCRAGDRHAQEALVRLCQDRVHHLACSLLGHREEALDAAQEALLAMWPSSPWRAPPAAFPGGRTGAYVPPARTPPWTWAPPAATSTPTSLCGKLPAGAAM